MERAQGCMRGWRDLNWGSFCYQERVERQKGDAVGVEKSFKKRASRGLPGGPLADSAPSEGAWDRLL